jgi:hypothetical protein
VLVSLSFNRTLSAEEIQSSNQGRTYAHNLAIQKTDQQSVQLSWNTQPDAVYQAEYLTNLTTNDWMRLGTPVPGTGAGAAVMDSTLGQAARFYRLLWTPAGLAATYYVAPDGSDNNAGTQAQPWATLTNAATHTVAGDTVLVQPGVYAGRVDVSPARGGTASNRLTFRANGAVTNSGFGFNLDQPFITIDGFTFEGGNGVLVHPPARQVIVTNCTVQNTSGAGVFMFTEKERLGDALLVTSCLFNSLTGTTYVTIQGSNCVVEKCVFANGYSCDALRLFGYNGTIRQCLFTNLTMREGNANHPDIIQTFGDRGSWLAMKDFLFERNHLIHCPIQLAQFTMDLVTNQAAWSITLQNNLFEDSNMQSSIDIPQVKFFNNTFFRCSNSTMLLGFGFYEPGGRGTAYGGVVMNNAFIECSGWYSVTAAGAQQGVLTATHAGGEGRTGSGYGRIFAGSGILSVSGTYTNLSGAVTGGMIYIVGLGDLYPLAATNFGNGSFSQDITMVQRQKGVSLAMQWGAYNAFRLGLRINTSAFPDGEISGRMLAYTPEPPLDVVTDYNYVGGPAGASQKGFAEKHGINGGNPELVGMSGLNLAPMTNSPLVGAGTNLSGLFAIDFNGKARPASGPWSIGAFEAGSVNALATNRPARTPQP